MPNTSHRKERTSQRCSNRSASCHSGSGGDAAWRPLLARTSGSDMNKAETAAGAVVVAVGAFMMVESMKMLYMVNNVPGPGFLPRLLAIGLIVSGLILTVKGIRPG